METSIFPEKLADIKSKNPEEYEVYIFEGDSLGINGNKGRDKKFM